MTKNELIRELAEEQELPRRQVAEMVESMLDKMTQTLRTGDVVALPPFGRFRVRDRAARIARNPMTGEPVKVPAKKVLKFIAAAPLKEAVGTKKAGSGAKKAGPAKKSAAKKAPAKKSAAKKAPARATAARKR